MKVVTLLFVSLGSLSLPVACGPLGSLAEQPVGGLPTGQRDTASLELTLDVPSESQAGEPIPLTLILRNTGDQRVQVTLGGRPPSDFVVTTEDGTEVWRWSEGQAIQLILERRTLGPGEELEYAAEWSQTDSAGYRVSPGSYLLRGLLNFDPPEKMETASQTLAIVSP